jgi:hypothetical protein
MGVPMTAWDHGVLAAQRGKHIQACPFDTGTRLYHEWRDGFRAGLVRFFHDRLAWKSA